MEEDRISQLPDEILQIILSFIDIYEVVETTILSKRWKHLWRSLPSLRFQLSGAASHRHVTLKKQQEAIDFSHFVSHFLSRRDATAPVHDFHFSLAGTIHTKKVTPAFVEECVLYAINHGVHSLRLCSYNDLRLPSALLTSTTLHEIKLKLIYNKIHVPGRFLLPNLKTLYLHTYFIFDGDHGMEIFSGLPELEKLSLCRCPLNGLVLKAPKLRVLQILDHRCVIQEISAPLLTSFRYRGSSPLECSKMNLPMLEQVYVDIYGIDENVKKLHRMLHQLGNAPTVSLTLDTRKVLELNDGPIEQSHPPFPNHKCLKVMKGRYKIRTVLQSVMNYLTIGTLYFETLKMEFHDVVTMVEKNPEDLCDDKDYKRMSLFLTG